MTENRNGPTTNYNDAQPYVVGILSPSTTLYIDPTPAGPPRATTSPPSDLNLGGRRQRTASNSFQITSVTVQGSTRGQGGRNNDGTEYDSADDLDDITSHTDDLSSDFLDSSRGYQSEDGIGDDLSPCGPIIFAAARDPNANSLGVTPTFASIGPSVVAGGVTMMTSKSESPVSAQVPIMNPLPDNWRRRFKVVKIMSSEPFQRGRWLCADFKDPPSAALQEGGDPPGAGTPPPTIQITPCGGDSSGSLLQPGEPGLLNQFAQVYEIPINQTFNGNFVVGDHQMYGIILPQNEHLQPVTLVQDMSLQTMGLMDQNFNNLAMSGGGYGFQHAILHQIPQQQHHVHHHHHHTLVNNGFDHHQQPSSVASANNNNNSSYSSSASQQQQQAVPAIPNHVLNNNNDSGRNSPDITANRTTTSSTASASSDESRVAGGTVISVPPTTRLEDADGHNSESCSTLASEVLQVPGVPKPTSASNYVNDGLCCSPPVQSRNLPPSLPIKPVIVPPQTVASSNVLPSGTVPPPTAATLAEINSSQTAPEKIPPSEVGHEVDPSAGSAASTGGNTVAIDNKIEQAMDLVKSHLMFAVREEVEVLKEKITELLERISQLEHENDILRANASAETLKQLSNQSQKKSTGGGNAGKPQSVATIPPST